MAENQLLDIVETLRERQTHWLGLRTRIGHIDALVSNRWGTVFPNDESDVTEPMVKNIFRHTIERGGRLFAEATPSERVPAAGARDETKAEEREQVLSSFTQRSGSWDVLEYHGQDMLAAGFTAIKVWPDFTKDGERFPTFRRLNPRKVLPEPRWAPDKPTDNVIVHYTETVRRLQSQFPEQIRELLERIIAKQNSVKDSALAAFRASGYDLTKTAGKEVQGTPNELEMVDWYSSRYNARVALYQDPDNGNVEATILSTRVNETGICPVQLAYRPTWSQEPLGDLDDTKGIVLTKNRYNRLLLDYFIQMVYGGKLAWNVRNPSEKGPGTVYYAMGPDAKMEPVTPEVPSFQALQLLGVLEDESHTPSSPPAAEGEVDLNKATAAFLSRAQQPLTSVVRSLQRQYAVAKRHANEAAFAQDEKWCDSRKTIIGLARGRRFRLTYTPSEIIGGDYANVVLYGMASGLDPTTHQVLVNQKRQLGDMSQETAIEQDPTIDDVWQELSRIAEGKLRDALVEGFLLPTTDLATRARAWAAFRAAKTANDALDQLVGAAAAPQPALGGAPAQLALPGPGSPPGIPGAEGTVGPAPPAAPLPPLAALRTVAGRR